MCAGEQCIREPRRSPDPALLLRAHAASCATVRWCDSRPIEWAVRVLQGCDAAAGVRAKGPAYFLLGFVQVFAGFRE
jgi:hypothetical protein